MDFNFLEALQVLFQHWDWWIKKMEIRLRITAINNKNRNADLRKGWISGTTLPC
jgi:hypothetical protein